MTENDKFWFEAAKIIASFVTPLTVLVLGIFVTKYLKRLDADREFSEAMMSRRLDFYVSVSERLNLIYCYFMHIGLWKSHSPLEVLGLKRTLDGDFSRALPYISDSCYSEFLKFEDVCFTSFQGRGSSAKLKANLDIHRESFEGDWSSSWDQVFVEVAERSRRIEVHRAYMVLLGSFGKDFGVDVPSDLGSRLATRLRLQEAVLPE